MKFLNSIKSMFTNNKEVIDFKNVKDEVECVLIDSNIETKNYYPSLLLGLKVQKNSTMQLVQIVESLSRFKVYPFKSYTILLCSVTIDDVCDLIRTCRFENNLIINKIKECISLNIPLSMIREEDKVLFEGIVFKTPDEVYSVDYSEEEDNVVNLTKDSSILAISIGVYYDDIEDTIQKILYIYEELTPYINKSDIYDLCKIQIDFYSSIRLFIYILSRMNYIKVFGFEIDRDKICDREFIDDASEFSNTNKELIDSFIEIQKKLSSDTQNKESNYFLCNMTMCHFSILLTYKQLYKLIMDKSCTECLEIYCNNIDIKNIFSRVIDFEDLENYIQPYIQTVTEYEDTSNTEETVSVIDSSQIPEDNKV